MSDADKAPSRRFRPMPKPLIAIAHGRGLDAVTRLDSVGVDLPLAEVYAGVEFASDESAAD